MQKKNRFCVRFGLALGVFFLVISQAFAFGGVGGAPLKSLDPDKKGWFVYQLGPGESYEDTFVVRNTSDQPWIAVVYPADQMPASGGGFALKQKVEKMTEIGAWIKMKGADENGIIELPLGPGENKLIPFTITVPRDVDVGETAGAIMVEKKDPRTLDQPKLDTGRSGVVLTMRTGTRVYNTVPGDIHEELVTGPARFLQRGDINEKTQYLLSYNIENKGSISSNAKIVITARNEWKKGEVFFDTNSQEDPLQFLVSPNSVFDYNGRIAMPKFGRIVVDSKLYMVDRKGTETLISDESFSVIIIPWTEVGLGALVLALIILFFAWRWRKYSGKGWDNYTVKAGDTITELSEKHGIDWKFLAKVNRIKTPFILNKGDKILVPPKKKKKNK